MVPPSDTNSEGFKPVVKPWTHKKAKTTPSGALYVKLEVKTELQVIFHLPKYLQGLSVNAADEEACT